MEGLNAKAFICPDISETCHDKKAKNFYLSPRHCDIIAIRTIAIVKSADAASLNTN